MKIHPTVSHTTLFLWATTAMLTLAPLPCRGDNPAAGAQQTALQRQLETALGASDIEEARALITNGADIEFRATSETDPLNPGQTLLMKFAAMENADAVKLLLDLGANVDVQDDGGWTALMYAISHDRRGDRPQNAEKPLKVLKALIEKGAAPTIKDKYGETAIKLARRNGDKRIQALLQAAASRKAPSGKKISVSSASTQQSKKTASPSRSPGSRPLSEPVTAMSETGPEPVELFNLMADCIGNPKCKYISERFTTGGFLGKSYQSNGQSVPTLCRKRTHDRDDCIIIGGHGLLTQRQQMYVMDKNNHWCEVTGRIQFVKVWGKSTAIIASASICGESVPGS